MADEDNNQPQTTIPTEGDGDAVTATEPITGAPAQPAVADEEEMPVVPPAA